MTSQIHSELDPVFLESKSPIEVVNFRSSRYTLPPCGLGGPRTRAYRYKGERIMSIRKPNVRQLVYAFSGALLLSMGLAHPGVAQTSQMTPDEKAAVQLVRDWFAAWNTKDANKVASYLSPTVVFHSSMISPTCQGPGPIMARYKEIMSRVANVSDVKAFAVADRRAGKSQPGWGVAVLTSRVDTFIDSKLVPGGLKVSGFLIVADGKIQEFWEEPAQRRAQLGPTRTCAEGL